MRIGYKLRLRKARKQALLNIADFYLLEQQRLNPIPYGYGLSEQAQPLQPVLNATPPTTTFQQPQPGQVMQPSFTGHTENDPALAASIAQLSREMDQPVQVMQPKPAPATSTPAPTMPPMPSRAASNFPPTSRIQALRRRAQ